MTEDASERVERQADRKTLLRQVAALIALTASPQTAEAESALGRAVVLVEKHKIRRYDVQPYCNAVAIDQLKTVSLPFYEDPPRPSASSGPQGRGRVSVGGGSAVDGEWDSDRLRDVFGRGQYTEAPSDERLGDRGRGQRFRPASAEMLAELTQAYEEMKDRITPKEWQQFVSAWERLGRRPEWPPRRQEGASRPRERDPRDDPTNWYQRTPASARIYLRVMSDAELIAETMAWPTMVEEKRRQVKSDMIAAVTAEDLAEVSRLLKILRAIQTVPYTTDPEYKKLQRERTRRIHEKMATAAG